MNLIAIFISLISLSSAYSMRPSSSTSNNVELSKAAENILKILDLKLPLDEFVVEMNLLAVTRADYYPQSDICNLHKLHAVLLNFQFPCNIQNLEFFSDSYNSNTEAYHDHIIEVFEHLKAGKPAESYAHKCINEFDQLASAVYSHNEDALLLMSRIVSNLTRRTMLTMHYYMLVSDFKSVKAITNIILDDAEIVRFSAVCQQTNSNQAVQDAHEMMRAVLAPSLHLRTPNIVNRLRAQSQVMTQPDTLKLVLITAYCNYLLATLATIQ